MGVLDLLGRMKLVNVGERPDVPPTNTVIPGKDPLDLSFLDGSAPTDITAEPVKEETALDWTFDKVYALTGGGPGNATETLSMYVYRLGFRFFDIGLASAAAVVMIVIAGALAAVYAARIIKGGDHV